jgi:hypothetical protein
MTDLVKMSGRREVQAAVRPLRLGQLAPFGRERIAQGCARPAVLHFGNGTSISANH